MTVRFALRNFAGKPVKFFNVDAEDLGSIAQTQVKKPTHHVIVIDRSGSMYSDIDDLKATIEKLLTLAEFNDDSQRVSLISYSSQGDVKLHFAKVTVGDVMKTGSPYLQEIRSIRVTGLTCISQALKLAETLVDDSEVTCISLHSDGYANDRSPSQEQRDIQAAVDKLKARPNVFINTVAYRDWCDFGLLSGIANQASGQCVQAKSIKEVYQALYNTQGLLAGNLAPVVEASIGKADYVVFVSTTARKVLGSNQSLQVRGLKEDDEKMVLRFTEVDQAAYNASTDVEVGHLDTIIPLAYARAALAEGRLNEAKYALVTSRIKGLLKHHYRALVSTEVAAMASDIEWVLFDGPDIEVSSDYGLDQNKATVGDVLNLLNNYRKHVRVNLDLLAKNYKRRGLKRVAGVRRDDGTLEEAKFKLRLPDIQTAVEISGFEFNRNTATINMLTAQKAVLVDRSTGAEITEVAGIKLDNLKDFKNYTLVGDGQVCTPVLPIRIADKRLFRGLADLGVVTGDFDPTVDYQIRLGDLPLVDFDKSFKVDVADFSRLVKLTAVSKILSATLKESSEAYTAEQIAALKEHYLSGALYFNPPTTNAYTDLAEALNKGEVDTRLSYKVEIGTPEITNLGKLPSANAFLERRFTLTIDGEEVKKPKLTEYLNPKAVWGIKTLSARTKITPVDDLLFPIFAEFLGLASPGSSDLGSVLSNTTVFADGEVDLKALLSAKNLPGDQAVEVLSTVRRSVDQTIDTLNTVLVSPLVFYVGSTGLVPDEFNAKALTAEQVEQRFPAINLSKDEKEGTFFVLPGDLLLTVYTKGEYFTVSQAA